MKKVKSWKPLSMQTYTLGSLAIDSALNRISEMISLEKKIPVGHRAIKEIDNIFIDKSFSDVGLMH